MTQSVRFNMVQSHIPIVKTWLKSLPGKSRIEEVAEQNLPRERQEHLIHVAQQAEQIAKKMGLSTDRQLHAYVSGIFHDLYRLESNDAEENKRLSTELLRTAQEFGVRIELADRLHTYHLHGRISGRFGTRLGFDQKVTDGPEFHTPGMNLDRTTMPEEAAILIAADKSAGDRPKKRADKIKKILQDNNYSSEGTFLAALYVMLKNHRQQIDLEEPFHPYTGHTVMALEEQLGITSSAWNQLKPDEKREKILNGEQSRYIPERVSVPFVVPSA